MLRLQKKIEYSDEGVELENFNATLHTEVKQLQDGRVDKNDMKRL